MRGGCQPPFSLPGSKPYRSRISSATPREDSRKPSHTIPSTRHTQCTCTCHAICLSGTDTNIMNDQVVVYAVFRQSSRLHALSLPLVVWPPLPVLSRASTRRPGSSPTGSASSTASPAKDGSIGTHPGRSIACTVYPAIRAPPLCALGGRPAHPGGLESTAQEEPAESQEPIELSPLLRPHGS